MRALLLQRLATAIPTLLLVVTASFLLMRLAPGGPFDGERPLAPETRAALEAAYGLDKPLFEQFTLYLSRIVQGDFGPSLVYRDFSVSQLVAESLPVSLTLGVMAVIIALIIGLATGLVAVLAPNSRLDRALMMAALLATALPGFITGPLLALVFGLWLGWLPVGGLGEGLQYWVLPSIALAIPVAGSIARLMRAALTETMAGENIRTARARGLSPLKVITRHALRPALLPVVSYLGPATAGLLTGAVIIETVFAMPGLGRYFVQGALNRDYPLIMAVIILYAGLIILCNLLADLACGWLEPRSRA